MSHNVSSQAFRKLVLKKNKSSVGAVYRLQPINFFLHQIAFSFVWSGLLNGCVQTTSLRNGKENFKDLAIVQILLCSHHHSWWAQWNC